MSSETTETSKFTNSKEILARLTELFPKCFILQGEAKPLKIGIFQDLAERLTEEDNISKTRLRQAIRHYTNSWRYLESVQVGAKRVDLDGNEGEEINEEHASYAKTQLDESRAKAKEKRAQQRKAERPKQDKRSDKPAKKFNKPKKPAAPKVGLKPVTDTMLKVGSQVQVKLGNAPVRATIKEVDKSDIYVELASGMVIKTSGDKLYSA